MQRVPAERLQAELAKVTDRRDPPVPVRVWLLLDGTEVDGVLHGWATNPNGGDDGLRGLVVAVREYAPGFFAEYCGWQLASSIRKLEG